MTYYYLNAVAQFMFSGPDPHWIVKLSSFERCRERRRPTFGHARIGLATTRLGALAWPGPLNWQRQSR
ncbi:MAG: hypothetical protein ACKPKO_48780, partial [Candidatus Fonsibacter sp.]